MSTGEQGAQEVAETKKSAERPFGGLTPREAGIRRQKLAREAAERNKALADSSPAPVTDDAVIEALRTKARRGDVAAARELRAWLDRQEGKDTGEGEDLTSAQLAALYHVVIGGRGRLSPSDLSPPDGRSQ